MAVLCQVGLGKSLEDREKGCSIDLVKRLAIEKGVPPIFYSLKSGEILYPLDSRKLEIENGQEVGILCHATEGKETVIKGVSLPKGVKDATLVRVQCSNGKFKNLDTKKSVNVANVACTGKGFEPIVKVVADSVFKSCSSVGVDGRSKDLTGQLIHVQIGWGIPEFGFKPQIDLCVDNKMFGTVWTNHTIMPGIEQKDKRPGPRPSFKSDVSSKSRFFSGASSSTMTKLYSQSNQVLVFKEDLNNNELKDGSEIIDLGKGSSDWFAKGHLSPDAAFIYDFEQEATYFFINVDPQFQAFNNGNWKAAEAETRKLADKKKRPLRVMQGTSHTLQYKNSKGRKTDVDLYYKDVTIPCNKYFWKVIHDVEKNEAIAFVGINDPHYDITGKGDRDRLFKDVPNVCDQLDWVGWSVDDASSGQMICASAEDVFNKGQLDNFPDLSDRKGRWPALIKTED